MQITSLNEIQQYIYVVCSSGLFYLESVNNRQSDEDRIIKLHVLSLMTVSKTGLSSFLVIKVS